MTPSTDAQRAKKAALDAIDPNIIEDGDGVAWMAFGSFWSGLKLVKLDASWTKLAEPRQWHAIARRAPVQDLAVVWSRDVPPHLDHDVKAGCRR